MDAALRNHRSAGNVFSDGRETMNFTLEPGHSATFRYRIVVLDEKSTPARIEREFTSFAADR